MSDSEKHRIHAIADEMLKPMNTTSIGTTYVTYTDSTVLKHSVSRKTKRTTKLKSKTKAFNATTSNTLSAFGHSKGWREYNWDVERTRTTSEKRRPTSKSNLILS